MFPVSPWVRAFCPEMDFPVGVIGPFDFAPLLLDASAFVIVVVS